MNTKKTDYTIRAAVAFLVISFIVGGAMAWKGSQTKIEPKSFADVDSKMQILYPYSSRKEKP